MVEKMRPDKLKPRGEQEKVKPAEKQEDASLPPPSGDELVSTLHAATEKHRNGNGAPREEISTLHANIERSEFGPLFEMYRKGTVPSIERMFGPLHARLDEARKLVEEERAAGGEEGAKELERICTLLAGREREVNAGISGYVQALIRHRNLRRLVANGRLVEGGRRDLVEEFERADHARRRAHERLLTSLGVYREMLVRAEEEDLFAKGSSAQWEHGVDARTISEEKIVAFSASTIADRDFVRDWALVVDFARQLEKIEKGAE